MIRDNTKLSPEDLAKALAGGEVNPPSRILVADDDEYIRRINTDILIGAGYEVESVTDGAAAWDALQQNRYDLLLTDNNMPKMTGLELIGNLQEAGIQVPVIMVTGNAPLPGPSGKLQIEAVLIKPYAAEELLAKVRNVLYAMEGDTNSALIYRPSEPDSAQDDLRQ